MRATCKPFASGGVIGTPTYFPLGTGARPCRRGRARGDHAAGARSRTDGSASQAARAAASNVTVNIATPDADSFRRSETYLTGQIARAVARGQRGIVMTAAFHEVLFPLDIALKSAGGPERKTEIVALGSGREERNARWAHSRRRYDAGYGVKTLDALSAVVAFFEERRGRLYGFRWRDRLDHSSAAPGASVTPLDQAIGTGDGATATFPLRQDLWRRSTRPISARSQSRSRAACASRSAARRDDGHGVHVRRDDRRRDVSVRSCPGARRRVHGGIPVRRAGAFRHRLSRSRSLGVRGRRDPENSAGGDQAVRAIPSALQAKLDVRRHDACRCWIVTRRDGVVHGLHRPRRGHRRSTA